MLAFFHYINICNYWNNSNTARYTQEQFWELVYQDFSNWSFRFSRECHYIPACAGSWKISVPLQEHRTENQADTGLLTLWHRYIAVGLGNTLFQRKKEQPVLFFVMFF